MPKANPIIYSFNGGEVSQKLDPRADLQKYQTSCRVLENFIPNVEGSAQARPGLYFVAEIKDSSKKARLLPFQFSTVKAYIVLAEEGYFRFFAESAQIITAPNTPYELGNPYSAADIATLKMTQSADILYLANRDHNIKKLSRTADTTWTLTDFIAATGGPLVITAVSKANPAVVTATGEDTDFPDDGGAIYISGALGMTQINNLLFNVTIPELMPNQVDRDFSAASAWANVDLGAYDETGDLTITASGIGQYCTCPVLSAPTTAGKRYRLTFDAANIVATWTIKSFNGVQTIGTVTARGAQSFDFLATETGGYRIVSVSATSSGDFDNFSLIKLGTFKLTGINSTGYDAYTSGGVAKKCLFGGSGDCPGGIAFFEQRFMAGGTDNNPLDVYGSASGDFENFIEDPADDSAAVSYSLLSDKVDAINWMIGEEYLMLGTQGGIWRLGASSTSEPLTATNVVAKRQLSTGVLDMDAEMIADSIVFVQRGGRTVRKVQWKWEMDKYTALDVTRIAKHITKGATAALSGITDMDYQAEPLSILWSVREDGQLLGMVYEPDENVYGWFHVITDGKFESVAVLTAEGEEDQVWVIVDRGTTTAPKRYVEYFKPHEIFNVYEDAFFVDSGLTWEGDAAIEITAISQAAQCTITAANSLANGNHVRFLNTGTWLDTHICTVSDRAAGSFKVKDADGTAYIDSTGFADYPPTTSVTTYDGDPQSILAVSQETLAKIVCTNHGLASGTPVRIASATGMTEINDDWTVSNPTDDTFEIALNSTTLTAYAGSGILTPGATVTAGNGTVEQVAKTLSGLDHLEDKEVAVLTDRGKHPARTVVSGDITLSYYAHKVTAGLSYDYNLQPMKIEPGTQEGTSRGRKKRIYALSTAFYQSAGVKWGPDADNLVDVPFGTGDDPVLFTGDKDFDFEGDYETGASIYIQGQSPLPCTVLSIAPKMVVTDG